VQVCGTLQSQLRLLRSSAADMITHRNSSDSYGPITTGNDIYYIDLFYNHNTIHDIIMWHLIYISKSIHILTYGTSADTTSVSCKVYLGMVRE